MEELEGKSQEPTPLSTIREENGLQRFS